MRGWRVRLLVYPMLYAAYALGMILFQGTFIYPFDERPFAHDAYTRQDITVPFADTLPVQVAQGRAGEPVILYFMGNAGALQLFLPMLEHHRSQGRTVIAMTYRGGGGTLGDASEKRLKDDALAVMDALPSLVGAEAGPVILHGYSLGTGLAVHVAARRNVDGVLLSAPYARLCELMAKASLLPACQLPGVQAWRSIEDLEGLAAPVLILHGDEDTLIPPAHSARLAEAMADAGIAVERQMIVGGAHSNLMSIPDYLPTLDRFIDGIGAQD